MPRKRVRGNVGAARQAAAGQVAAVWPKNTTNAGTPRAARWAMG